MKSVVCSRLGARAVLAIAGAAVLVLFASACSDGSSSSTEKPALTVETASTESSTDSTEDSTEDSDEDSEDSTDEESESAQSTGA